MPDHARVGGRERALGREDTQDTPGLERGVPRLGHGRCSAKPCGVHLRVAPEPGEEDVGGREARHLTQEPGGRGGHGQDADGEAAGRRGSCGDKPCHAGATRGLGEAGWGVCVGAGSLPVPGPGSGLPCSLGTADASWGGLLGRLSAQAMLAPEAHSDTGKDRRLLRLWEPLTCSSSDPSSTAPLGGAPATSQDRRASCRSSPTARQVKEASPWSHGPRRGGRST